MLEIINGFFSSTALSVSFYIFGILTLKNQVKEKNKIMDKIVIMLISIILYTFIFLSLEGILKTISLCILFMITFKVLFNINYSKALIASITYIVILIIPDLLVTASAIYIFNLSKDFFYSSIVGSILGNVLVSTSMILVTLILKKPLKKLFNYNLSTNKKIVIMSLMIVTFITYFFYEFATGYELNQNIIIYIVAFFSFIIILFMMFKQNIENEAISKNYDDLLNIMKNYESDVEEQRTLIHETRNELMTIKCKINDKEKEAAIIEYIDSILGDKQSSNMSKYSKFKYLPSNGIKGFFYYKFMEAEKREIKVSVNISKRIENSFLGDLNTKDFKDLVRMIGVYLDNAIEASSESTDKKLGIEIYQIKDDIEIIISNTFENEINTDKIGIEKFTTKGKNHGHGLLLVKHILNNNSMFESEKEIKNGLYIQKIKIKNEYNNK